MCFSLLHSSGQRSSTPEIGALTGFGAGLMMDVSQTSPGPMGTLDLGVNHRMLLHRISGRYGDDNIGAIPSILCS
jgi:hypothetical protein